MEGPSLYLAAEWLAPFSGKRIQYVDGNTHIGKERLEKQKVVSIFSYGKYLFFQFEYFALRVHFLLYGSFDATFKNKKVTGDYPTRSKPARLLLEFSVGKIVMYDCSLTYIESSNAQMNCDYSIDVMSESWDERKAISKIKQQPASEIADVLLDQSIFMGVGNIIKNEVLLIVKISPLRKVSELSTEQLKMLVSHVRSYVFQFYDWRKQFVLKKHYQIYRQTLCKQCGNKVVRKKTGLRKRLSFICPHCQSESEISISS
jgi:endonuclease-8